MLPRIVGMSTGDTRCVVAKAVLRLDTEASERRWARAAKEWRACITPKPDGRGFAGVDGSAEQVLGFWGHLTALTQATCDASDPRALDQQRADLLLPAFAVAVRDGHGVSLRAWLGHADATPEQDGAGRPGSTSSTSLTGRQKARLQAVIVVPVKTALGLSDNPADLVGYGPITGPPARDLLADASLHQAAADQQTGRLVALSDEIIEPPRWMRHWPTGHYPDHTRAIELDSLHDPCPTPRRRDRRASQRGLDRQANKQLPAPPCTLQDALVAMLDTCDLTLETTREKQYRPSKHLATFAQLCDPRCIGPGCSHPAGLCDLEHWLLFPEGPTGAFNLAPASRRCHNAKTYGGWTFTPTPTAASPGPARSALTSAGPAGKKPSTSTSSSPASSGRSPSTSNSPRPAKGPASSAGSPGNQQSQARVRRWRSRGPSASARDRRRRPG